MGMAARQVAAALGGAALVFALSWAGPAAAEVLPVHGFVEAAAGARLGDEKTERPDYDMLELRLQFRSAWFPESLAEYSAEANAKVELMADGYDGEVRATARELYIFLTPADFVDVKAGRQILTWGTGDYLFINDLFPKDYVSFFIGRDDEYLKLPSDALRALVYLPLFSLDAVVIPRFAPNRTLRGDRLSFYDAVSGAIGGRDTPRIFERPARTAANMETALRAFRTFASYEAALYFFNGFYKNPFGMKDPAAGRFYYPELTVYGASLRGPAAGGIVSVEAGYYDSREDRDGANPFVENGAVKTLLGYSRDLGNDLKAGVQYELDVMLDYDAYTRTLAPGSPVRDELRHLFTLRLSKLMYADTLRLGLFVFYSPSDEDAYLRPTVSYKASDTFGISAGANVFAGKKDHTEFGQADGNDNLYVRMRWDF